MISPNPMVNAGVVVGLVQVAVTPLFAAAVETDVTVPPNPLEEREFPDMSRPAPRTIS